MMSLRFPSRWKKLRWFNCRESPRCMTVVSGTTWAYPCHLRNLEASLGNESFAVGRLGGSYAGRMWSIGHYKLHWADLF